MQPNPLCTYGGVWAKIALWVAFFFDFLPSFPACTCILVKANIKKYFNSFIYLKISTNPTHLLPVFQLLTNEKVPGQILYRFHNNVKAEQVYKQVL